MRKFIACMMALCMMSCSVPVVAEETSPVAVEAINEEASVAAEALVDEEPEIEEEPVEEESSDFVIEGAVLVAYLGSDAEVTVPEEVTEVGAEAFAGNEKLESVYFAGDVVKIGKNAFADCVNLEEIGFADIDELKKIESKAFAGCEKLNCDWAADIKDVADDAFDKVEEVEDEPVEIEPETDADESDINEAAQTLEITSQPQSVELNVGETAQFTVAASGDGLSYRWYICKPGGSWAATGMSGYKTDTLSVGATLERNGYQYRCVVTDAAGDTVTSEAATLTVTEPAAAFEITSQPKSVTVTEGEIAKFTVAANDANVTYRWEILKAGSTVWSGTTMPGNRTATLSVEAKLDRSGNQYRCIVTDAAGNIVTSEAAALTVTEAFKITSQPQSVKVYEGDTAEFTVVANGENLTYRWEILKAGSTTWSGTTMPGNRTATLSVGATLARSGNQYRCIVTDASGNIVTSEAAMLTVAEELKITSQPQTVELAVGETAQFTVAASGSGLSYRWYICKPGGTWAATSMEGCKTETLSVGATLERNGNQYRCVVTDDLGNKVTSEAATLMVFEPTVIEITSQPQSVELPVGEIAQFTVEASGDGLSYRWYICKPGGTWAVTSMEGCRTATLSVGVTLERSGNQYRCVITDAFGNSVSSEAAMLTVISDITLDDVVYERTSETTVSVKSYAGSAATVVIPETVEGYTVTAIGESAFEGNTGLVSIDLPDTIEVIGKYAFKNCTSLTTMN